MLLGCQTTVDRNTIASLQNTSVEVSDEKLEGGLEKAIQSYERFLEETPDSNLAPEAIRRLADLKIEHEYGIKTVGADPMDLGSEVTSIGQTEAASDLERPGALEAIALYKKLLKEYPSYEHNDQVLYQMSRAYEEIGNVGEAMAIMGRLASQCPDSRFIDEVQFRRAEHFFMHRHYLDAEDAYKAIVEIGADSTFYDLALYKLGWTFYKQELYPEALDRFVALLDYMVSTGYDFDQTADEMERKRSDDTFRVVSLSFSNIGGADSVIKYFDQYGQRRYEDRIYSHLAEFYFDKRRYADASATYDAFISRNPFHHRAPNFHMRMIEIYAAGGFPSLVLESKKAFARKYDLFAEYWHYFKPDKRKDVLGYLKTNLIDLANHYHACYQDKRQVDSKTTHLKEALNWYRRFLASFPSEEESPTINYQLAALLLETGNLGQAAIEYEKTAYDYPMHEKAPAAGYAAVCAYRDHLEEVDGEEKAYIMRETVRNSLMFADTFPQHEKSPIVLGAAVEDLYNMKALVLASSSAHKLLERYPDADATIIRTAWLVIGHSSYELKQYSDAEAAYVNLLALVPETDEKNRRLHTETVDNLAAAIYKQGEQANDDEDYETAVNHFLRVGHLAPESTIRANAEFDGASALIKLEKWEMAATVLNGFRDNFPGNSLQPEVTKKIAYVYMQSGRLTLAASEYERIETESEDDDTRREALLLAADLYIKEGRKQKALEAYRRCVKFFPDPVEENLETRNHIAEILKEQNRQTAYLEELQNIVTIDAMAGDQRTDRTRWLAASAGLVLAERQFDQFTHVQLVQPIETNLAIKQDRMKAAVNRFKQLLDYEFGEITAAANYYLGETYAHFSHSLMTSERPQELNAVEREEYDFAIEEQAYPFEEEALKVHESNLKLISMGVYNEWIEKSLEKLVKSMPARYGKTEENSLLVGSPDSFVFTSQAEVASAIEKPTDAASQQELTDIADPDQPTSPAPTPDMVEKASMSGDDPVAIQPEILNNTDGPFDDGTEDASLQQSYVGPVRTETVMQ